MKTQEEDSHLQAKERGPGRNQPCPTPWSQNSSFQNCATIHFWCLRPPCPSTQSGPSLQRLWQTNTPGQFVSDSTSLILSFVCHCSFGPSPEDPHAGIGVTHARCLITFCSVLACIPGGSVVPSGPWGRIWLQKRMHFGPQMRNFLQPLQALLGRANRDVTVWIIFILFSAGEESLSSKLKHTIQYHRN